MGTSTYVTLALSRANSGIEELCELLEARAFRVNTLLRGYFQYVPVADFLARFNELHKRHLSALRAGNSIVAHEFLNEIHELSFELSRAEFWARDRALHTANPNIKLNYSLNPDAFESGPLIEMYVRSKLYPTGFAKNVTKKPVLTEEMISAEYASFLERYRLKRHFRA